VEAALTRPASHSKTAYVETDLVKIEAAVVADPLTG
jgi:hypothetical protein